jgi:hypothetical protein
LERLLDANSWEAEFCPDATNPTAVPRLMFMHPFMSHGPEYLTLDARAAELGSDGG